MTMWNAIGAFAPAVIGVAAIVALMRGSKAEALYVVAVLSVLASCAIGVP